MIDSFNPPGVWSPFGAFSMGVVQGDGQVVYLKGQVSLDRDGQIIGNGDMQAQVWKTLRQSLKSKRYGGCRIVSREI